MILEFKLQTKFFCSIFWSISKWNYYKFMLTTRLLNNINVFIQYFITRNRKQVGKVLILTFCCVFCDLAEKR